MPAKTLARKKKSPVIIKKRPSAPSALTRQPTRPSTVAIIDYPKEGEKVLLGHYAIRISAKPGLDVEVNSGDTNWAPCRKSLGFLWHDWWPSKTGSATLNVRIKVGKGRWKKAADRRCVVIDPEAKK